MYGQEHTGKVPVESWPTGDATEDVEDQEPTEEPEGAQEAAEEPQKDPYDVVFWRSNGEPLVIRREGMSVAPRQAYKIAKDIERSRVFVFNIAEDPLMPTTILVPAHEITSVVFQAYHEALEFPYGVEPVRADCTSF